MGQKVNPYGFRLGITTDWKSRWFEERNYQDCVIEDWEIRDYLMSQLESAAVSRIEIERTRDEVKVILFSARPGVLPSSRATPSGLRSIVASRGVANVPEAKKEQPPAVPAPPLIRLDAGTRVWIALKSELRELGPRKNPILYGRWYY